MIGLETEESMKKYSFDFCKSKIERLDLWNYWGKIKKLSKKHWKVRKLNSPTEIVI
jgi:hypothetical protein